MKSKLEYFKDLLTAIQGLKANAEAAYKLAVEEECLSQDYGLYQIIALIELAARDIASELETRELLQKGIETDPYRPL